MNGTLHFEEGGEGDEVLVLLHGLGATGVIWRRVMGFVHSSFKGRWFVPDLRGHGRSQIGGPYGYAVHAADVAGLLHARDCRRVTVVGHSFGAVVGTVLASGWFGVDVVEVFAMSVKTEWTDDEVARMQSLATRPKRLYANREDAAAQFLKVTGISGLAEPTSLEAISGVMQVGVDYQVAVDPGVYSAVGPDWQDIYKAARCPVRFCVGDRDAMVPAPTMLAVDPTTFVIKDAGHNPHWEQPRSVASWFLRGETLAETEARAK